MTGIYQRRVPLSQLADIRQGNGASFIYREQLARYVPLRFAVRGRDLESAISEARDRIAHKVKLLEGVHLEWAGEYGELSQALRRLGICPEPNAVLGFLSEHFA